MILVKRRKQQSINKYGEKLSTDKHIKQGKRKRSGQNAEISQGIWKRATDMR